MSEVTNSLGQEKKRQALWLEAVTAWEDYQISSLHMSEEEAEIWFDQLEAGLDVEPPACHQ